VPKHVCQGLAPYCSNNQNVFNRIHYATYNVAFHGVRRGAKLVALLGV